MTSTTYTCRRRSSWRHGNELSLNTKNRLPLVVTSSYKPRRLAFGKGFAGLEVQIVSAIEGEGRSSLLRGSEARPQLPVVVGRVTCALLHVTERRRAAARLKVALPDETRRYRC